MTEPMTRRDFIKTGMTIAAAGTTVLSSSLPRPAQAQAVGANGDLRIAVVGFNQKGQSHITGFPRIPGVRLVALCDVDPNILKATAADYPGVFTTTDFRQLLDRNDIDAITIAAPNHWHAPMTIAAVQAGKDVYCEKPASHSMWEGVKMAEAARKYGKMVQIGTQTHSAPGITQAVEYVKSGKLGKIQYIHGMWLRLREPIGLTEPWYPDWLDYSMFCGTAPMAPLRRDQLHYDWHWMWDTGNGDSANLGVHMTDVARWFAGAPPLPKRVTSMGGRFGAKDSGETPDTQLCFMEFPEFPFILETRNLPTAAGSGIECDVRGLRSGVIVQCENGYYSGYFAGSVFDNKGTRIEQFRGQSGMNEHFTNWVEACRSRDAKSLVCGIEDARISTSSVLASNIAYRIGQPADAEAVKARIGDIPYAQERAADMFAHAAANKIDLAKNPMIMGAWLSIDPGTEQFSKVEGRDDDPAGWLRHANAQQKAVMREPFAIKDQA